MVVKITIDYSRCTCCKKCVEACTFDVLEWFEKKPIVTNPSNCSGCLECEASCTVNTIRIEEK
jgi:MinD superfamily P-loop ATPase